MFKPLFYITERSDQLGEHAPVLSHRDMNSEGPQPWLDVLLHRRQCNMHINEGDMYNICILCPLIPHLYIAFGTLHEHRIPDDPQFMGFNKTQSKCR